MTSYNWSTHTHSFSQIVWFRDSVAVIHIGFGFTFFGTIFICITLQMRYINTIELIRLWSFLLGCFVFTLYPDVYRPCTSKILFNLFLTSGTQIFAVAAAAAVSNQRSHPFSFNCCTFKEVFFVISFPYSAIHCTCELCNLIKSVCRKYDSRYL